MSKEEEEAVLFPTGKGHLTPSMGTQERRPKNVHRGTESEKKGTPKLTGYSCAYVKNTAAKVEC